MRTINGNYTSYTESGFKVERVFVDVNGWYHIVARNEHRDRYAFNVGTYYNFEKGYWGQGYYDFQSIDEAVEWLYTKYNIRGECFLLESR